MTHGERTLSGIAEELERRIEAFHDGLPQGQGETGDGGKAGKELCQWVYDNAETLATLIRTADDRDARLISALQAVYGALGTARGAMMAIADSAVEAGFDKLGDIIDDQLCQMNKALDEARQALGGTNA